MKSCKLPFIANADTGTNTHWQVMMAWIETSDVKFPGVIEMFEACGSLIYCSRKVD